jgi:hypothetical protein
LFSFILPNDRRCKTIDTVETVIIALTAILLVTIGGFVGVIASNSMSTITKSGMTLTSYSTELTYTSIAADGYLEKALTDYAQLNANATATVTNTTASLVIGQDFDSENYTIDRSFLYFNVTSAGIQSTLAALYSGSSASDITIGSITAGVVKLTPSAVDLATNFTLILENNAAGVYPTNPLATTDFLGTYYTGNSGNLTTVSIAAVGTAFNISLTSAGRSWVSSSYGAGNLTRWALVSSLDVAATAPTNSGLVTLNSSEATGGKPTLYITVQYTVADKYTNVQGNNALNTVTNSVYSSFSIASVVPLAIIAGVIVSIIIGVFVWKKQGS